MKIVSENVVIARGNFPAICESNFQIQNTRSFFVVLTGDNGSGKTTLLKGISGKAQLVRGCIKIDDENISNNSMKLKKLTEYVGHGFHFLENIKVIEHLELNKNLDEVSRKNDEVQNIDFEVFDVNDALEFCKLSNRKNVYIEDLSAGQKRRLHLASAFMRKTKVVLIDEPHASLDSNSKDAFDELFMNQFTSGRSMFIATHDPQRLNKYATDFLEIINGVVIHKRSDTK